jgi:hypothetical protein
MRYCNYSEIKAKTHQELYQMSSPMKASFKKIVRIQISLVLYALITFTNFISLLDGHYLEWCHTKAMKVTGNVYFIKGNFV